LPAAARWDFFKIYFLGRLDRRGLAIPGAIALACCSPSSRCRGVWSGALHVCRRSDLWRLHRRYAYAEARTANRSGTTPVHRACASASSLSRSSREAVPRDVLAVSHRRPAHPWAVIRPRRIALAHRHRRRRGDRAQASGRLRGSARPARRWVISSTWTSAYETHPGRLLRRQDLHTSTGLDARRRREAEGHRRAGERDVRPARVRRSLRIANTPRWLYLPGGAPA